MLQLLNGFEQVLHVWLKWSPTSSCGATLTNSLRVSLRIPQLVAQLTKAQVHPKLGECLLVYARCGFAGKDIDFEAHGSTLGREFFFAIRNTRVNLANRLEVHQTSIGADVVPQYESIIGQTSSPENRAKKVAYQILPDLDSIQNDEKGSIEQVVFRALVTADWTVEWN